MTVNEIWKDIPGYEGLYQVSNTGIVKALERTWYCNNACKYHKEFVLKQNHSRKGYFKVRLCKNGYVKSYLVARLVAIAFIKNPLNKKQVNHIDGNKQNNHVSNLEWVTNSENCYHAIKNNLRNSACGERIHSSKLTKNDIAEIRKSKLTQVELARKFKVRQCTISQIKHYKTWRHI